MMADALLSASFHVSHTGIRAGLHKDAQMDGPFKFKKTDRIGTAGAEDDGEYLKNCYVDTGLLEVLKDTQDPRQLVIGRTGTGKSALLLNLKDTDPDRVVFIHPEDLALTYISNSTILKYFSSLGVNLDPFFKLLWRHVLTVEVLIHHFKQSPTPQPSSLIDSLRAIFGTQSREHREMQETVDYLQRWGKTFWEETEYRVKEITEKFEHQLQDEFRAQIGSDLIGAGGKLTSSDNLSTSQTSELVSRAQHIVSQAQVRDLTRVVTLLDRVLGDRQKSYYIVVDKLDEAWVDETMRLRLVMALMVTARDFNKVRNAKAVISLRRDLIEQVFREIRDSGFQEEKFHSLFLPISWSRNDLIAVLDRRIDFLVKRRYTRQTVTHRDLLPEKINGVEIDQFLYEVAPRPRDIIALFNTCITYADDSPKIKRQQFDAALGEYSRDRLRALADEWSSDYPSLPKFFPLFFGMPPTCKFSAIDNDKFDKICLEVSVNIGESDDALSRYATEHINGVGTVTSSLACVLFEFYKIGLIGIKPLSFEKPSWVDQTGRGISRSALIDDFSIAIHPSYHRALGTTSDHRRSGK